ncbi:hypothetical protein C5B85_00035 [Pseudoclavibacter sp. AY1F1]|uniref:hypothetical protein n=1 Tax=Pseudoclavibacter sp. AY1F1 TaxID=2080583 RepID=UPI000CE86F40|nr:hypothetical protein [Pseudoclavibacter sp. AY1F1]PPF46725.1 hypothetical protein C5B85_00035 [Pseudoclavibacter sp. AY1F1]
MNNARGYGILQFELNGPARSIAMGNKLRRQDEAESGRLSDVLRTPFARAEELRQATRGPDLHRFAKASTGIRFRNEPRAPVPATDQAGAFVYW